MLILRKISTPDDMIDNYLDELEYHDEKMLYDRNVIETLMIEWAKYEMTEDKTKYENPIKWNSKTSKWE